jgi:hypothetical protein
MVGRVDLHISGTGNVGGKIAAVTNPTELVVTGMEHEGGNLQRREDGAEIGL